MTIETIQDIFLTLKKYDNLLDEKRNNITDIEEQKALSKEKDENYFLMQRIAFELNKDIQENDLKEEEKPNYKRKLRFAEDFLDSLEKKSNKLKPEIKDKSQEKKELLKAGFVETINKYGQLTMIHNSLVETYCKQIKKYNKAYNALLMEEIQKQELLKKMWGDKNNEQQGRTR